MKSKTLARVSVVLLIAMILSACSGVSIQLPSKVSNLASIPGQVVKQISSPVTSANTPAQAAQAAQSAPVAIPSGSLADYQTQLESVYNQVNASVVNINVVQQTSASNQGLNPFNPFSGQNPNGGTQIDQALASGFVWDTQGHIVTNNHVVDGATKIEVTFSDGTTVPATVVGTDVFSDLAVIKVDGHQDLLHPVQLADPSQTRVGQVAIAIGNPFGLEGTMTVGVVSAMGRSISASQTSQLGSNYSIPDIIQTDAPINPGNSGGVLVNLDGQLIGVPAAIESNNGSSAGIGFAIPTELVQNVIPTLIEKGKIDHPYLGISGTNLTSDMATAMNLPADTRGALVEQVVSGGPADKAGLKASQTQITIDGQPVDVGGDIITGVDSVTIKSMDDLIAYLMTNTQVGQQVELKLLRDGKEMTASVTLGARPTTDSSSQSSSQSNGAWLGVTGVTLSQSIDRAIGLPSDAQGILVTKVESGSPAEQAGIVAGNQTATVNGQQITTGGDIIVAIDGQAVTSVADLRMALQVLAPGEAIQLTILRNGALMDLPVILGEAPTGQPS